MGYQVQKANVTRPLYFLMVLSSDHVTGATAKSPTVTLLKSGGSFAAPVGAVTEVANGLYKVAANATDADTIGPLFLHATASGCDPRDDEFEVLADLSAAAVALSPSSATTTAVPASRLIDGALRLIGVLRGGETADPDDANDALVRLNELVDSWLTQGLTATGLTRTTQTLTTAASYTIGPGGTFNQAWPEAIPHAGLVYTTGGVSYEWPLAPLTPADYARVPIKAQTSPYPMSFYYTHAYSSGLGTVTLWPVPDGTTTLAMALYTPTVISQFASLATTYALPPAYAKALRYNLACDLWPEYPENPIPGFVVQTARETKADLKRANMRPSDAVLGIGGLFGTRGGYYDINTG